MTNIMYRVSILIATLAMVACQPVAEETDDTDTTPECGEDETAVVPWCEMAKRTLTTIWCEQCGDAYSCEHPDGTPMFVCDQIEAYHGTLNDCVSKQDAAHCLSEIAKETCGDYDWPEGCNGFSDFDL